MDWFFNAVEAYGPVVYFFTTAGLGIFLVFVWKQLNDHEDSCERYRAAVRGELTDIREDIHNVETHVREDVAEIKGMLKGLSSDIRNGNGTGCAASKRRKTSRPVARTRKAGAKRSGGPKKTTRRR